MPETKDWKELAGDLNRQYGLSLLETAPLSEWEELLAQKINGMIDSDFAGLIRILYRIDVEESKLRYLLNNNKAENTGLILARLIIERQMQKIMSRRNYKSNNRESDEESW
jgi:hypothetical protein